MSDAREALVALQRDEYGASWDVLVPEVGWTLGRIIESVIEDVLAAEHDHEWQRRQNVTSRGYRMPPYEVCVVDGCGAARQVDEPAAHPPAPPTVKPSVEALADALAAEGIGPEPGEPDLTPTAERLLAMLPGRTEAEVKAEALREVADWLAGMVGESGPGSRATGYGRAGLDIIARIRDRAARIEKGEGRG